MEPHHVHGGILWDGWVLMLPGVFVAAVLATALASTVPARPSTCGCGHSWREPVARPLGRRRDAP